MPRVLFKIRTSLLAFAWLLVLVPRAVHAQRAEAAAEALFRAGRDASQRGDAQTACDRFRESYRLEPALGTLLNIATCELSLGRLSESWRHFQDVAHALPADDPRVAMANTKLAELERRLARLTVQRAASAPPTLELSVGDMQLGAASFGVALPMDPGSYVLEARAPQREPRRYTLQLAEGEQRTLEVEPGPALAAALIAPAPLAPDLHQPNAAQPVAPSAHQPPPARSAGTAPGAFDGQRAAGFALLGAGAVSALAGITCIALVLDRAAVVDDQCGDDNACSSAKGLAAADSGEVFYVGAWVSLGLALAASGAGAFLLITADDPAPAPHIASAQLRIIPEVSPRTAGARLRLQF